MGAYSKYVKQPDKQGDHAKPAYDLFAVDNHYGSLGGGHYTAYAKHKEDSKWYLFDDSTVTQVDESKVVGDAASGYVLFYLRKDKAQSTFAETMET
jgi:ubiquitin carboxyl-terminal hydrolase 4/11/15